MVKRDAARARRIRTLMNQKDDLRERIAKAKEAIKVVTLKLQNERKTK